MNYSSRPWFQLQSAVLTLSLFFSAAIFTGLSTAHAKGDEPSALYTKLYAEGSFAQDSGQYLDFVKKVSPQEADELRVELVSVLKQIRKLSANERRRELNLIFNYYSKSRDDFRTSALVLTRRTSLDFDDLVNGDWEPKKVAEKLIAAIGNYENTVTFSMLKKMEAELAREFPRANIFFLGRDMSVFDLWARQRGILNTQRLFTANISRMVRDAASNGQNADLVQLIRQLKLDKQALLKDGIVFIDSSMGGKIPAVTLAALMEGYTDRERYELLSKTHIRYLRSSQMEGESISQRAAQFRAQKAISAAQAQEILNERAGIPVFEVGSEKGKYFVGDFEPHNFFEHRPKFISSAVGMRRNGDGVVRTLSAMPTSLGDRVNSILGLLTDITIVQENPAPKFFQELNEAWKRGYREASDWEDIETKRQQERFENTEVRETRNSDYPFELVINGKQKARMIKLLGEGANVRAYLGEGGTVIKVVKNDYSMQKSLHAVWAMKVMDEYGIEIARILTYDRQGVYVEQELIPGESLEELHAKGQVTQEMHEQVLNMFNRAKKLAEERGIYLDLKAGNVHVDKNGRVVNVDYVPRVNSTYWRYFRTEDGRPFTDLEFLDLFYNYDRRKKDLPVRSVNFVSSSDAKKLTSSNAGGTKVVRCETLFPKVYKFPAAGNVFRRR